MVNELLGIVHRWNICQNKWLFNNGEENTSIGHKARYLGYDWSSKKQALISITLRNKQSQNCGYTYGPRSLGVSQSVGTEYEEDKKANKTEIKEPKFVSEVLSEPNCSSQVRSNCDNNF